MRKVLKDRREVAHYWANQVQAEGKAGNVFFDGPKLYSYGRHFVIARILPSTGERAAVFTKQGYSSSTAQHQSIARAAWGGRFVWTHDADHDAARNKHATQAAILAQLRAAETDRRILQRTRDGHKAKAVRLANEFNEYLAALPEHERNCEPFNLDADVLPNAQEFIDDGIQRAVADALRRNEALRAELADAITRWRAGEDTRHGLHSLPPMLRLVRGKGLHTGGLLREGSADVIETSHGAEIPASAAPVLWAIVQRVRNAAKAYIPEPARAEKLGHYTLKMIRDDGSIVVGCHDIAYSELQGIAAQLGLIETATA